MALGSKRGGTIHNKTGDEKNRLKAKYDAGDHTALENFPAEAAVLYQMQQMDLKIFHPFCSMSSFKLFWSCFTIRPCI